MNRTEPPEICCRAAKPLVDAAEQALNELLNLHGDQGYCPSPESCPTATAIRDLEEALAAERKKAAEPESTYPAMKVRDIPESPA